VVIVSVFGKSQLRAKGCKADMLSSIFQVDLLDEPKVDEDSWVRHLSFENVQMFDQFL
jgi:hypothetical protein